MVIRTPDAQPVERLANWRIAVLALYALGGAAVRKHGEDVAIWCHEFAPQRFSWERYPQYPNQVTARAALEDAKREKNGAFVTGGEREGWLLTKDGLAWCEENAEQLGAKQARQGPSALPEPEARALRSLSEHRLFEEWQQGVCEVALYEVADALRFPADAPSAAVYRRVEELAGAAHVARMDEMEEFLEWLRLNVVS